MFAVGHTNISLAGRCLAAVLGSGPGSLLSHYSAGWLLGLIATRPIPVHVTTPLPRKRRGDVRIHRSETLIEIRTLRRVIRRAEELEVFDLRDFRSILTRNQGHRGAAPLSRALAIYEPPRLTRSEFEREFVALAEGMGLPAFATNFSAAGYELDVYWPQLRFGVELDVYATHGAVEPFEDDRRRDEDLKLAGVELTRVTAYRFELEPRKVMERVSRLLSQRREQLGGGGW